MSSSLNNEKARQGSLRAALAGLLRRRLLLEGDRVIVAFVQRLKNPFNAGIALLRKHQRIRHVAGRRIFHDFRPPHWR